MKNKKMLQTYSLDLHHMRTDSKKAIITLTEAAVSRIKYLMEKRNSPALGIKVGVKSGGCSGLAYTFEYADVKPTLAEEVTEGDVTVFIEPKAVLYLLGTQLDYKDEKTRSGFVFINPNEKGRCGCGESFYT